MCRSIRPGGRGGGVAHAAGGRPGDADCGVPLPCDHGAHDRSRLEAAGDAATYKSVRLKLIGTKSNRDGIGAVVKLSSGGETQSQMLRSGSSYLSASELVLTFGLAQRDRADSIDIRWPGGQVDKLSNVPAGQTITLTECKGITGTRKYGAR